MKELGKLGSFFGIITFLFGFFILFGSPTAGVIVMIIGVLILYGSSRSGGQSGGRSRSEDIERYSGLSIYNPSSPYYYKK
jgi:hypothetical protein